MPLCPKDIRRQFLQMNILVMCVMYVVLFVSAFLWARSAGYHMGLRALIYYITYDKWITCWVCLIVLIGIINIINSFITISKTDKINKKVAWGYKRSFFVIILSSAATSVFMPTILSVISGNQIDTSAYAASVLCRILTLCMTVEMFAVSIAMLWSLKEYRNILAVFRTVLIGFLIVSYVINISSFGERFVFGVTWGAVIVGIVLIIERVVEMVSVDECFSDIMPAGEASDGLSGE